MANFITRQIDKFIEKRVGGVFAATSSMLSQYGLFGTMTNHANVEINEQTSQKLSAFYEAVTAISEDIARLPVTVMFTDSQGNKVAQKTQAAARIFDKNPNPVNTPFTLKELLIRSAIITGNGYGLIVRDSNGTPTEVWYIPTEYCVPYIKDAQIVYNIQYAWLGVNDVFTANDVFHLRGQGNGWIGISVLTYANESLANGIATQNYGNTFLKGGGKLSGVLSVTAKDPADLKKRKDEFNTSVSENGFAVINNGSGTAFTKIGVTNNEAQFIENKMFNVKDVHRWLRYVDKADFNNNLEQWQQLYVNSCLMPWIVRFEEEVEKKMLTEAQKPFCDFVFDTKSLLRGDSAAQERIQKTKFYTGQWTINDMRRYDGENTIGPDGDMRFFPVNMVPDTQLDSFWESKDNKTPQGSPDASGSGASNGNIKQQGT